MIPWSAVQNTERSKIASVTGGVQTGGVTFRVNIDPAFGNTLKRNGFWQRYISKRRTPDAFAYLPLNALVGDSNTIADEFERYFSA